MTWEGTSRRFHFIAHIPDIALPHSPNELDPVLQHMFLAHLFQFHSFGPVSACASGMDQLLCLASCCIPELTDHKVDFWM